MFPFRGTHFRVFQVRPLGLHELLFAQSKGGVLSDLVHIAQTNIFLLFSPNP